MLHKIQNTIQYGNDRQNITYLEQTFLPNVSNCKDDYLLLLKCFDILYF